MKISVITPTEERSKHIHQLHRLLQQQSHTDWEWLIYDTSLYSENFSDPKIQYFHHSCERISIGEKRNSLIQQASGDVIVHCDDDDYYAPNYLETIAQKLTVFDFFHFHSWLSYQIGTRQFFYWDTEQESKSHYVVDSLTQMQTREIDFGPLLPSQTKKLNLKGKKGYGFSFAYIKEIWKENPFPHKNLGEDIVFFNKIEKKGSRICSLADQKGLVVHILHSSNISKIYPQYRIPSFLLEDVIPHFFAFLCTIVD